jgi:hypothetical protein
MMALQEHEKLGKNAAIAALVAVRGDENKISANQSVR